MKEIWKPILGYEDYYEVSSLGRVRRVKGGAGATAGRILRPGKDGGGYRIVILYKKGISKTLKVSRLVLIAFAGLPAPGKECNHKNGIKADDKLENLEWVTSSENSLHKCRILGYRGEVHGRAKLKNNDIPVIRRLLAEGKLVQREIGELFGVSRQAIWYIKHGNNWAHI